MATFGRISIIAQILMETVLLISMIHSPTILVNGRTMMVMAMAIVSMVMIRMPSSIMQLNGLMEMVMVMVTTGAIPNGMAHVYFYGLVYLSPMPSKQITAQVNGVIQQLMAIMAVLI